MSQRLSSEVFGRVLSTASAGTSRQRSRAWPAWIVGAAAALALTACDRGAPSERARSAVAVAASADHSSGGKNGDAPAPRADDGGGDHGSHTGAASGEDHGGGDSHGGGDGSGDHGNAPGGDDGDHHPRPPPATFEVVLATGTTLQSTLAAAKDELDIDPEATLGTSAKLYDVESLGHDETHVSPRVSLHGNLWSIPPVSIGPKTQIQGAVRSGGAIGVGPGATIAGGRFPNTTITSFVLTFPIPAAPASAGPVHLGPGDSRSIAPGAYDDLVVGPHATASLTSGTYFFGAVATHPDGTVQLDESAGPVIVYVTGDDGVDWHATLAVTGGTGTNFLLVAMKGSVDVEATWAGTIVAPRGDIRLRATAMPHVAQLFARELELSPKAVLLFGGFDWGWFCPLGDSDDDGVPDCQDSCPLDPGKTSPGLCGCGKPETDSDGDGVPDCIDACPHDPTNTAGGQCGCAGSTAAAAGTPCGDGICSSAGATGLTCNGAGQCGNANDCSPDPGHCTATQVGEWVYWVCTGPVGWSAAAASCAALPGQALARIDTSFENSLLASLLAADHVTGAAWLGGDDAGTVGTWQWITGAGPAGDTFFTSGAPVGGAFTAFAAGAPGDNAGRCLAMTADGSATWQDRDCAAHLAYVCKRSALVFTGPKSPPLTCADFSPNLYCPPASTACVASDPNLPSFAISALNTAPQKAALAQLVTGGNTCLAASCTKPSDPGCAQCTGPFAVPPAGSTCLPFPASHCGVTNTHGTCQTNADCGPGEICDDPVPTTAACDTRSGTTCTASSPPLTKTCGTPVPGCEPPSDPNRLCNEVTLCAPPGAAGDPNPLHDPTSSLSPSTFDNSVFSPPTAPAPIYPQDPACSCSTPPCTCNLGVANRWCHYDVPNPLGPQNPGDPKHGSSGSGGLVQFDFDPNLTLSFTSTPMPFGESKFNLVAAASLSAGASFDFGSFGNADISIIDALAALKANRCRAWTTDSHLKVFTLDFTPLLDPVLFDTNPSTLDETACNQALDQFQTMVDRAKKAMKDAQELLRQYNAAKSSNQALVATLCQQIAADPPAGFPAGNCATEPPEQTINRFIDFYTMQAQNAFKSEAALAAQVLSFKPPPFPLVHSDHEEDQTLFSTTFLVGPIPVNVSVQSVEKYGVDGDLQFSFDPGNFFVGNRQELAHAWGQVQPYANAGVSLFLGVGFDIGIASAEAGVEGIVTLGNITVPVVAGAGIDVQPEPDARPLPADLAPIAGPQPLFALQQYQFLLKYDYGVKVDINQILAGALYVKVHVSFLFFDESWRAEIVNFGDGFSLPELVLVQGSSGGVALGDAPWGVVQMPTPFVSFAKLAVPASPPGPTVTQVSFDPSQVEKLFYDSQCVCDQPGTPCFRSADCCSAAPVCFSDPQTGGAKTCITCRADKQSCNTSADCCAGEAVGCYPSADTAGAPKVCLACLENHRFCDPKSTTATCCPGTGCNVDSSSTTGYSCYALIQ